METAAIPLPMRSCHSGNFWGSAKPDVRSFEYYDKPKPKPNDENAMPSYQLYPMLVVLFIFYPSSTGEITRIENVETFPNLKHKKASSGLDLFFNLEGSQQLIRLSLQPNAGLTPSSTSTNILGSDGETRTFQPELTNKAFKGSAFVSVNGPREWRKAGWARVVFDNIKHPNFEGAYKIDGDLYHIEKKPVHRQSRRSEYDESPSMAVRRDFDTVDSSHSHEWAKRETTGPAPCSFDSLDFNHGGLDSLGPGFSLKRQSGMKPFNPIGAIGDTDGCPTERRVALIGIATDCSYTAEFDSLEDVRSNVLKQINTVSQVYEDAFNISLRVANLTISDRDCPVKPPISARWNQPCTSDVDLSDRLGLFSRWKGGINDGIDDQRTALWSLFTSCQRGSTVGISWLGQICRPGSYSIDGSEVASASIVVRTSNEWQVIAHEIAHSFGASHDCTKSTCGSGSEPSKSCCPLSKDSCDAHSQYLMNPSAKSDMEGFSPCTVGTICSAMRRSIVRTDCLIRDDETEDLPALSTGQCGNGIVEEGEDCDCGGEEGCDDNSCCVPSTCRFVDGASCDPSHHDCCTDQCQPARSGIICRESIGACDPEEVCDGTSIVCPSDEQLSDGEACIEDGLDLTLIFNRAIRLAVLWIADGMKQEAVHARDPLSRFWMAHLAGMANDATMATVRNQTRRKMNLAYGLPEQESSSLPQL
ncbi:hypothetical protein FZEAL_9173 [Fusarium zealandicum]|uniref:Disintegrin and metalloproteinase domain-containing protein B n=1 Tax=Fusarium zealandicum TaxID=1053134 RepID=A0A8H4UCG3_9HYPO|nr:hypothetical protein FZEAL_9173 [Fusarium zealandicum]